MSTQVVDQSHQVLQHHAKSFSLAAKFLPSDCRDDAAVVYSFCRLVDDLADEAPNPQEARANLATLEEELRGHRPPRPLISTFLDVIRQQQIDVGAAHELIEGCRSDLNPVKMQDQEELLRYCYRVAGVVGLMMCGVLGVTDPTAHPFALDLGIAMQLTNICRDVAEDAERGRVYLPADRLVANGTSSKAVLQGTASTEQVAATVSELLALADVYYDSAWQGLHFIPWRTRLAIRIAGRVYRAIGWRLRRFDCDALAGRTVVPRATKLTWIARESATHLITTVLPRPPSVAHDAGLHVAIADLPGAHIPKVQPGITAAIAHSG